MRDLFDLQDSAIAIADFRKGMENLIGLCRAADFENDFADFPAVLLKSQFVES